MSEQDNSFNYIEEFCNLFKACKFKEALEKHLWFHEASRDMPGMGGVRLSFALGLWRKLAEEYPPAMEVLIDLKNRNRERLLQGNGNFDIFHDFSSINRELKDDKDTTTVFIEIHKKYPEQADIFYNVAEDSLVSCKAYEICDEYISEPDEKLSEIQYLFRANMRYLTKNPSEDDVEFIEYAEDSYVNAVCRLIEILKGVHKNDIAKDIQSKALEYLDNKTIRAAI